MGIVTIFDRKYIPLFCLPDENSTTETYISDSQTAADGVGGVRVGRRFGRTSKENPSNRLVDREKTTSRFGRLHQRKMSRLQACSDVLT